MALKPGFVLKIKYQDSSWDEDSVHSSRFAALKKAVGYANGPLGRSAMYEIHERRGSLGYGWRVDPIFSNSQILARADAAKEGE